MPTRATPQSNEPIAKMEMLEYRTFCDRLGIVKRCEWQNGTSFTTNKVRDPAVQRLKGGLGEHVSHANPCVLNLGGIELARNRRQAR